MTLIKPNQHLRNRGLLAKLNAGARYLIPEHELSFCSSKWEIHWSSRTFHNLPVFYMTSLFCASVSSLWRKTWDNEIRARKRVFWGLEWEILVYVHLVCCFGSVVTQCPMQAHRVLGHIWWCSGSRKRGRGWHEVSVSSSWTNLY